MSREIYKSRKTIALVVVSVVLLVAVVLLIVFRDSIAKAYKRLSVSESDIVVNSGELADGNFPISIANDDIDYQFGSMGKYFVMLSDTHMYVYSKDGTLKDTRQHDYTSSVLKYANNRTLVYESGGKNFKVESPRSTVYSKVMDNSIVFARINSNGYVAVVTTAEMYSCELTIYNEYGDEVYHRGCVDRIEDLCFTSDSNGCVVATVSALEGQIVTQVMYLNFANQDETWTTDPLETLCLDIQLTEDGNILLFGDTKCAYYDMQGNQLGGYSYKNELISGSCGDGKCAILFDNEERRKTTMLLIKDVDTTPIEIVVDNNVKKIYVEDSMVYVLKNDSLDTYDFDGNLLATSEVSDTYKDFIKIGDEMFLISYDCIDKIDYQSKW